MAKAKNEVKENTTAENTNLDETTAENAPVEAKNEIDWNEKVPLLIQRDPTNPKETDYCICVNGKIFQIQRGVEVMVPRYVKQVYLDSVAQLTKAYDGQIRAAEAEGKDLN